MGAWNEIKGPCESIHEFAWNNQNIVSESDTRKKWPLFSLFLIYNLSTYQLHDRGKHELKSSKSEPSFGTGHMLFWFEFIVRALTYCLTLQSPFNSLTFEQLRRSGSLQFPEITCPRLLPLILQWKRHDWHKSQTCRSQTSLTNNTP